MLLPILMDDGASEKTDVVYSCAAAGNP